MERNATTGDVTSTSVFYYRLSFVSHTKQKSYKLRASNNLDRCRS